MKNKFIALVVEAVIAALLAIFLIWKLYKSTSIETGMIVIVILYLIAMGLIVLQGYLTIIRPYTQRTKELEKIAEESEEADAIRREFVSNVSHELKTPLTSITGFVETLQAGAADDPEIRNKFIDIIAIETSRLKRLISDLLVLSDIENKEAPDDETEFNVKKAVMDTIETLEPIADEKSIEMFTDLDDTITITGSVDRFCQMMMNLIENAIKYSYEQGRVWISAYREDDKKIVSVKDEGIGIAPEHHDRLFERFYRVDKSRSNKVGGTGLGLSIVKHIAALFGAGLKVESQEGEGSTFFVIFEDKEEMGAA